MRAMLNALRLRRLVKTFGDNRQPLLDLRRFHGERHQNAQHVIVRPAGEQDQTLYQDNSNPGVKCWKAMDPETALLVYK